MAMVCRNNVDADHFRQGRNLLLRAGRQALLEYQIQLRTDVMDMTSDGFLSPLDAHYERQIGPIGFVFIDTRLHRTFHYEPDHPFLGERQLRQVSANIERFASDPSVQRVVIVTSVPLMFAPSARLAYLADLVEGDKLASHRLHRRESGALLDLAGRFSNQTTLLAGDVHMYLKSQICPTGQPQSSSCFEQVVTSGLTVASTKFVMGKYGLT